MMARKRRGCTHLTLGMLLPLYVLTVAFIFFPIIYMVFLSFMTRSDTWGFELRATLENYMQLFDPLYLHTFVSSLQLAVISTACITVLGYAFGYYMARLSDTGKRRVMFLLMIPFWTSSLIRLYGWIIIFRSSGVLDTVLQALHITDEPLRLLYTYPAVVVGMVYALLPFMILSVYSSAEKIDRSLIEAAHDLGARGLQTFWTVSFPLTLPGLLSGIVLTFVPSMGLFFVADVLGGSKIVLIGSLIQEQMTKGRNVPFAAALSVILMLLTSAIIGLERYISSRTAMEEAH
ncbi:MAG TPA: ABC transporter permease [Candidatus Treponema faecavium]|nr:ABC transporter permease [Candidatus Treponema faecavium]